MRRKYYKGKRLGADCKDSMIRLGENLRTLRLRRGMSLRGSVDLLNMFGIGFSLGVLAEVEAGNHVIMITSLLRLARFYGVTIGDLLETDMSVPEDKELNQLPKAKYKKRDKLGEW